MLRKPSPIIHTSLCGLIFVCLGWGALSAQAQFSQRAAASTLTQFATPGDAREALARARETAETAQDRAESFAQEAATATAEADRLTRESAALAARIQKSEADILAVSAQLAIIADQRRTLDARLAVRQQPLVRLTGALQNMARRPVVLSALQPGSLKDTVYLRAVLETTLPTIRERTASLRSDIEQSSALEREAQQSLAALEAGEVELEERRRELAGLAGQQQQASSSNRALAQREEQRALALVEEVRDLDALVSEFDRAGAIRRELARLPGPIMRPPRPDASRVMPSYSSGARATPAPGASFQLPVHGQTVSGFGEESVAGQRNTGVTLAPAPRAQIVAPAAGRISFAGPYPGFGRIIIVEHENGLTSLITGLERASVSTGDRVIGGSPIGTAGVSNPQVTYELRENGTPINPLIKM